LGAVFTAGQAFVSISLAKIQPVFFGGTLFVADACESEILVNLCLYHCLPYPFLNFRPYEVEIVEDDWCFCNVSALKHWLPNIKDDDLVYVSFKCDYYEVPFFVALDHCTKSIVIALRGSFGMKDLLADCAGMPTPFTIEDGDTVQTFLVSAKVYGLSKPC
jgi:hypothetical protein